MANGKISFDYDKEYDILFIYHSEKKAYGSIEYGKNIHISFDKKDVVGLELLDASTMLEKLTGKKTAKNDLTGLKKCNLYSETHKGLLLIKFECYFLQQAEPIKAQLILNDLNYKSPLLAVAK